MDLSKRKLRAKKYRRQKIEWIKQYKTGKKCINCGFDKCISALHFHHTDPTQKKFRIAHASRKTMKQIKNEIKKCIILCANCHAIEHEKGKAT